jgi:hypothetical protein
MAHSFGDLPEGENAGGRPTLGGCTNRLIADSDFERLVGQCRQSAIPVTVRRAEAVSATPG